MSEPLPHPRRILHLVLDGFPVDTLAEIMESAPAITDTTEHLVLKKANAREALDLIFASDTIAVWGKLQP